MNDALQQEIRYHLLKLLAEEPQIGQRQISERMGISLDVVNYCLRELAKKGWIKIHRFKSAKNKVRILNVKPGILNPGEAGILNVEPGILNPGEAGILNFESGMLNPAQRVRAAALQQSPFDFKKPFQNGQVF